MRRKIMAMALVVMLGLTLAGCQTPSGYYDPGASAAGGMLGGAAGGAALGAIIGAATGNPGAGAWIGAATGAGVGAIGGSIYASDQNMARARAAQGPPPSDYGSPSGYGPSPGYGPSSYSPSSGNVVAIDQAYVNPVTVQPGSQILLTMNYRVMAPQNQPVSVQLVREISKDGQLIDQPYEEPRQVQNGPHAARVAYHLPAGATPGNYVATFRVVSSQGTSERRVNFSVQ